MSEKKMDSNSGSGRSILCENQGEEQIWNDFLQGDREAFSTLYHRFFKLLIHSGLRITSDIDLVKDCVHDLFVEIWKSRANLATPDSVKAYLIISIRRKILRQLKKIRSVQADAIKIPVDVETHSAEELMISNQQRQERVSYINKALNCLTKRQKEAVYLKFYANLSYAEIGAIMAISTDAIYNLVSKAIDNLQGELSRAK